MSDIELYVRSGRWEGLAAELRAAGSPLAWIAERRAARLGERINLIELAAEDAIRAEIARGTFPVLDLASVIDTVVVRRTAQ